jgi:GntR family transcriptional repressor for pyruvate dehydrogenase complex
VADSPAAASVPKPRFRSLGRNDLVGKVVLAIEGEILGGRLPIGAKLPPEREFADRLGVSRTVVREAVRILVTKGLLQTRHGIGTTVREVTHEQISKPLTLFLRTSGKEVSIEHLHQVRSTLEVESASLASRHATSADIEELRRICTEMQAACNHPERFAVKDTEFHRCLGQTTHNPLITLLLDSINELTAEVRKLVADEAGLFERVMPGHLRILEAIAEHNPQRARKAMTDHLSTALAIQKSVIQHEL